MSILQIRTIGDPVLRREAEPVESIDEALVRLAESMVETMHAYRGIGLAAPQVGASIALVIVPSSEDLDDPRPVAVVNPVLRDLAGKEVGEEGCLSVPGFSETVTREKSGVLTGLDLEGRELCIEADGFQARVFQHELDHLRGVLYVDRLSPLKREFLLKRIEREREEEG